MLKQQQFDKRLNYNCWKTQFSSKMSKACSISDFFPSFLNNSKLHSVNHRGPTVSDLCIQLSMAEKYRDARPSCPCFLLFPTPAEPLNETRPTTKHTSGFIPFAQPGTALLSRSFNILPPPDPHPRPPPRPQPAKHVVYPTMTVAGMECG